MRGKTYLRDLHGLRSFSIFGLEKRNQLICSVREENPFNLSYVFVWVILVVEFRLGDDA